MMTYITSNTNSTGKLLWECFQFLTSYSFFIVNTVKYEIYEGHVLHIRISHWALVYEKQQKTIRIYECSLI